MAAYMLIAGASGYTDTFDGWSAPAGACVMVIEYDGVAAYTPPAGLLPPVPWDGRPMFQPPSPPPVVPAQIEKWQLQVVLATMPPTGKFAGSTSLLGDANALAAQAGGNVLLAWNGASTVARSSPTIAQFAPQLGLTSAQVDAAFVAAASVAM
jgi:hypothetical protein